MADERTREEKLAALERLKATGEKAYDDMYEAHDQHAIDACYRDAKDYFYDAISLARELGLTDVAESLSARLDHIKSVYRSQFAG
jgi:hypothetical protein